ncbi:MAG: adenosylcobinamide-GDP ribazoletransferase [Lachnospiraceae bacterium]|jgi:adenosylcobinamide-GDP ribazoletransferase
MKRLWNSFKIAMAMYSKIPVPQSDWNKENMRYAMCFFPAVGVVIGVLTWLWGNFAGHWVGNTLYYVILVLIPVFVTGGIHLDGLLDTADALSSYQERERKLEILKDSHAGAFAIIVGITYFLLYYGVYSEVSLRLLPIVCIGFVLSRTLSAYGIAKFPMAKNTGLAHTFSDGAQKQTVRKTCIVLAVLCLAAMCLVNLAAGLVCFASALAVFGWYYHMSMKQFGGITGDLAGFFLQICELVMTASIVLVQIVQAVIR